MRTHDLAFVYSHDIESLSYPEVCPFKTHRSTLTRQRLISLGLLDPERDEVPARPASLYELQQFHAAPYLDEMQRAAEGQLSPEGKRMGLGGYYTPVFYDMLTYGAWAAGAALTASDLLLQGRANVAFSLLGGFHHATVAKASGFCYVNDVALACKHLAGAGKKVAYVDMDAHHGNGVQEAFYCRKDVLTISLHDGGVTNFPRGGFEPEIGKGAGLGYNVNIPLPPGTYDEAFLSVFDRVVMPLLGAYRPDVLVLELGMDSLAGDPLSNLNLSNNIVVDVMQRLVGMHTPVLVAGGGGYQVENTVRGWALAWRTVSGEGGDDESSDSAGGLRDPHSLVTNEQRKTVIPQLEASIAMVTQSIFQHHGLAFQTGTVSCSVKNHTVTVH